MNSSENFCHGYNFALKNRLGRILFVLGLIANFHLPTICRQIGFYPTHDYARYTPGKLHELFAAFTITAIIPLGTYITAVYSKIISIMQRMMLTHNGLVWWQLLLLLIYGPFSACLLLLAYCSFWLGCGSENDLPGYTIYHKKL